MECAIPLSRASKEPLFRQVYSGLRKAILAGTFASGDRLPSTRDLAEQLGISRTVVLVAYDQLLAEGFIAGRGGSGTYISEAIAAKVRASPGSSKGIRLSRFGKSASAAARTVDFPAKRSVALRYDFAFGRNSMVTFPFEAWRQILVRKSKEASVRELDYGPASGTRELREAICSHVRRSRGVACDASEVIIVNGAQQALDLVSRVLIERGDRVVIESPHYQGTRELLRAAGARLIPIAVDREGLEPSRLPKRAAALFVTPSHQFPTGAILSLPRRMAVLQWAARTNAVIVENDYDSDFHYEGRPVQSLQGLDTHGRVIYIGTFSRTMFPALRIGYVIVPKALAHVFSTAKWLSDQHSATLEQLTLAEFISSGRYERYLRRLRRANTLRRDALLQAIREHCDSRVELTGEHSGAHVMLWPRKNQTEAALIRQAAAKGVGIYGTSHCYMTAPERAGIVVGYARMNEKEIREGIRLLAPIL